MKAFCKIANTVLDWAIFSLGGDGALRQSMVAEGVLDLSGEGRDAYGH